MLEFIIQIFDLHKEINMYLATYHPLLIALDAFGIFTMKKNSCIECCAEEWKKKNHWN